MTITNKVSSNDKKMRKKTNNLMCSNMESLEGALRILLGVGKVYFQQRRSEPIFPRNG